MASNAVDGQAMVDAYHASGKILQIGLQNRFTVESRTLRKLCDEGILRGYLLRPRHDGAAARRPRHAILHHESHLRRRSAH